MFSSIQRFIVDQSIVLMITAFIIGMLFQPLATALNPIILYLIMIVMYLSFFNGWVERCQYSTRSAVAI